MKSPPKARLNLRGMLAGILAAGLIYGFQAAGPWPPPVQQVSPESPALTVEDELKTFFLPPG